MRLPRWLLVSLIAVSAVALVAVPAWLWVEMPRRMAAKFIEAIEANDSDAVNQLLVNARCEIGNGAYVFSLDESHSVIIRREGLKHHASREIFGGERILLYNDFYDQLMATLYAGCYGVTVEWRESVLRRLPHSSRAAR